MISAISSVEMRLCLIFSIILFFTSLTITFLLRIFCTPQRLNFNEKYPKQGKFTPMDGAPPESYRLICQRSLFLFYFILVKHDISFVQNDFFIYEDRR